MTISINLLDKLHGEVKNASDSEKAKFLQRFFKTNKGEYGFGDIFVGLTVPQSRIIAKKYKNLGFGDIDKLLISAIHEERLIALLILVDQFNNANSGVRKEIFYFYLARTKYINNWDLVDLSADKIVGRYLLDGVITRSSVSQSDEAVSSEKRISCFKGINGITDNNRNTILIRLAKSHDIWERRISIISTFTFIKAGRFKDTLKIAELLINDKEDLIHKAVGWMLREVGKRVSVEEEEIFLKKYYNTMPRTMLRYAIEKFPNDKRKAYLKGTI